MKKLRVGLSALAAALLIAACGSGAATTELAADSGMYDTAAPAGNGQIASKAAAVDDYAYEAAEEDYVYEAEAAAEEGAAPVSEASGGTGVTDGAALEGTVSKMLIRNVDLEVETTEFDALTANITAQVEALGGYVESFNTSNYSGDKDRSGYFVARVPSEELDQFLDHVSDRSNIVYRSESVRDVTLEYVDLDTHKKAMLAERDRLLELLEKAETVADIIEIESRLSEVSYEIESLEVQLRMLSNQVTYSTVYINIREVEIFTPAAEKSVWKKISDGFGSNVYWLMNDLEDMAVGFVISLPYIIAWVIGIALCIVVVRLLVRIAASLRERGIERRNRKKQERERQRSRQESDYVVIPTGNEREEPAEEKDGQDGTTV